MDQENRHGCEVKNPDLLKRMWIALLVWGSSSFGGCFGEVEQIGPGDGPAVSAPCGNAPELRNHLRGRKCARMTDRTQMGQRPRISRTFLSGRIDQLEFAYLPRLHVGQTADFWRCPSTDPFTFSYQTNP
jgi:hypothetical protein